MPLLNYTMKVQAERTIGEVMRLLVSKGAREIITVYDDAGVPFGPLCYLSVGYQASAVDHVAA